MSTFVLDQLFEFSVLLYGGMVAALIYDLVALYQKHLKPGKISSAIQDFLYWMMMASVVIYLLYYSSLGRIRPYMLIALFFGYIIYKVFLSNIVYNTIENFFRRLAKIIKSCILFLSMPVRKVYKNKNTHPKL